MSQPVFLWVILPNRGGDLTSGINVLSTSYVRTYSQRASSHARSGILRNSCSQMDDLTCDINVLLSLMLLNAYFPVGMMSYFLLYPVSVSVR